MKKLLLFEGAGWSCADISRATIGNCRIRTAFHLDDGRRVYLELTGSERTRRRSNSKELFRWPYTGFVDFCHEITEEEPNDDANKHQIKLGVRSFEWSLEAIKELVNSLGASFDEVVIAPDYSGYSVFNENKRIRYNYGDEFILDPDLCRKRAALVAKMKEENARRFNQRHDNTSYYVNGRHLMMRYNVSDKVLEAAGITDREVVLL